MVFGVGSQRNTRPICKALLFPEPEPFGPQFANDTNQSFEFRGFDVIRIGAATSRPGHIFRERRGGENNSWQVIELPSWLQPLQNFKSPEARHVQI